MEHPIQGNCNTAVLAARCKRRLTLREPQGERKEQKDGLAARLEREREAQGNDADLPELSLHVVKALTAKERLTIKQLAEITGANRNTLKVRLRELVTTGRIRQHGKARATWYSL